MKKIALFLLVLISAAVVVGCNNKKSVVRFTPEGETIAESSESNKEATEDTESSKKSDTVVEVKTDSAKPAVTPAPIVLKEEGKEALKDEAPVAFEVTSLEKNQSQKRLGYHLIEGTTPKETAKILVNDYPLSKYKAGETKWSYITAVSLGNLKKGDNDFTVKAVDTDGKELGSKVFTLAYAGIETAKLASTGPNSLLVSLMIAFAAMGLFAAIRKTARGF
jgi:hypothetical protein